MSIQKRTLLIIDDDRFFCDTVKLFFAGRGIDVFSAHRIETGKKICAEIKIDVVLLDQKLPDGYGLDLCAPILAACDQTKIIFITAYPSFDNAIKAIRSGAFDYLLKPVEIEELDLSVERAFRTLELEKVEQIQNFKNRQDNEKNKLIGANGGLKEINRLIDLSAASDASVMITGETGTGKNVVAKSIHYRQSSKGTGFVGINCAALPENLIESELFGHEKGAFTGAVTTKKGIFEMAQGGTLFLDEIGELPLHLQSKLLGILDDKKLKRIGGQSHKKINVRILAATNLELTEAILEKKFRQDLYYRLSVIRIHIPPLRNRKEDIPELCSHFLQKLARNQELFLPPEEIRKMLDYHWPGNVRELRNVIERAIMLQKDNTVYPSFLLGEFQGTASQNREFKKTTDPDTLATLEDMEKGHIRMVLDKMNHNHTHAARILGVSRSTLIRKLGKYQIDPAVAKQNTVSK